MFPDQCKKLDRSHLKRNGNILIGIDHNHVILLFISLEIRSSVISRHLDLFRHIKILVGQISDRLIDLDGCDIRFGKIPQTLPGVCAGTIAEYQYVRTPVMFHAACHQRRRHRIVIVHAR